MTWAESFGRMVSLFPFLVTITATTDAAAAVSSLFLGAEDHIRKPFGLDETVARMDPLLERRPRRSQRRTYRNLMVDLSGFGQIRGSRNLFEGKMRNICTNTGMFQGNGANLTIPVKIDEGVFVQIPCFGHIAFPPSEEELRKLAEQGRKFLEKRRRNASQYQKKLKEKGIDSSILLIKKEDLDKVRAMAGIQGKTLNGMLVKVIRQGIRWRREILESYVRGEIRQERAVGILELGHPSELSKLLALEGLPVPM